MGLAQDCLQPARVGAPGEVQRGRRPEAWDKVWIKHPVMKRSLDLLLATIGLIVLWPFLIVTGTLVGLTSPGPVFYRGVRSGRFGVPFRIFKFRTMVVDAEFLGGTTTGKNDRRVTSVGRWLRKLKLDELPQLLNVLIGDMSLVGPRPEVEEYTSKFTDEEQVILAVRPGITDLSSLHFIDLQAHVGQDDPDELFRRSILPVKNALRITYVHEQSFLGDLWILFRTVGRLATRTFVSGDH